MSVRVSTYVWEHAPVSGNDLLLLLAIADHANDTGGGAWPSIKTLAAKIRVSERTAQRAVWRLAEQKLLTVEVGAGPKGTNLYAVVMHRPEPTYPIPPDTGDIPDNLTGVTPERHRGGDTATSPEGRHSRDTRTTKNRQGTSPRIGKPSAAAPPQRCPHHPGQYARFCGPCRGTALGEK